jgi:hypothetical protein
VKNLLGVSAFVIAVFFSLDALGWGATVVLLCDIMRPITPWESFNFGLYVVSYLGACLVAPSLLVAAALVAAAGRLSRARNARTEA